jgi:hypothetical protein
MARPHTDAGDSGRDTTLWDDAVAWAHEFAATADPLLANEPQDWDTRAVEGILAVTAYVLAVRHNVAVRDLGAEHVIVPFFNFNPDTYVETVAAGLATAGHQLTDSDDPVSVLWAWLTREWPRDEFGELLGSGPDWPPRWSMGGRCAPRPAVVAYEVMVGSILIDALAAERGAMPTHMAVRITGGEHAGRTGRIDSSAWIVDGWVVAPGLPPGYAINFGAVPGSSPVTVEVHNIAAEHVEPAPAEH